MSPRQLLRGSAVLLVVQFLLCLAGGLLHPVVDGRAHSVEALTAPLAPLALSLILAGTVVGVVALPGAIAWLAPHVGRVGTGAAVTYWLGLLVVVLPHLSTELFVAPVLARDPAGQAFVHDGDMIFDGAVFIATQTIGGLVMMLALAVLGVCVVRSALPSWIGWVMVLALVLIATPIPLAPGLTGAIVEVPRGLATAAIGVLVLRDLRRGETTAPRQVPVGAGV